MKHPFIPEDAPFTGDQKSWIAGFKAGLESAKLIASENVSSITDSTDADTPTVNILYGTQTGNAEGLAMDAADIAKSNGINPVVNGLDDISIDDFSSMQNVIVSIATYGEGEMPDNAQLFWEALSSEGMNQLPNMNFAVLALGDTGYDEFCQAGKLLDKRLEELGATRLVDRIDCDVDYEDFAEEWLNKTIPLTSKNKNHKINSSYGGINDELKKLKISKPTIKDISNVVCSIRKRKLPDPKIIGNAGSFFKNPVVKKDKLEWIKKYFNDVPSYKLDDKNYKIPAAWLIESAGLKGKELDGFGIHKTQPLVLVNYGGAKGEDIYKLSLSIKEIIFKIFKIELETEVNII